jgi:signal transduction histidine kinase
MALSFGALLLVKWVEATLVNDLKARNEQVLADMSETLGRGQIPSELLLPTADEEQQFSSSEAAEVDDLLSSTYFYIDGDGIGAPGMTALVDPRGGIELFRRTVPPPDVGGEFVEVERDLSSNTGTVTLHAVSSRSSIERSVRALTGALFLGLPLLVLSAGVMTWLIAGRTLAPVGAMTRRVRELSATKMDARVPIPDSGDEIAELAETMNDMLDRLQRASVAQRQFVSDASHELRSPVASIRAQLETALRYPDDVDWEDVARVVLREDERLDHLVANLLAMARLEEGRHGPRTEVDVEDIVMAQAARFSSVRFDTSAVSAGRVWANQGEITSVVRNLVDNAVRHAEHKVTMSVVDTGPWVVIRVGDDGEGVKLEDRERIFGRFARLEEGRTRDGGGAGLGLALSRRITEAHGGRIHVEDCDGGGACFVVSLPSAGWGTPQRDDAVDESVAEDGATSGVEPGGAVPKPDSIGAAPAGDSPTTAPSGASPTEGAPLSR